MSIPGLGQIPVKPPASAARTFTLQPYWEYRFEVAHGASLTLTLLHGRAERDGTELAVNKAYTLSGAKSKILTFHGATIQAEGTATEEYVSETLPPTGEPGDDHCPAQLSYLNLHALLQKFRGLAAAGSSHGPRVLVAGAPSSGRTSLVRTLAAWAARQGGQPVVVNADPSEGMLSLPGTLSAAVFATLMDVESESGWGSAPTSAPGAVPVKLPLVYYYGRQRAEEEPGLYSGLVSALAGAISERAVVDPEVRASGMLVDAPPYTGGASGVDSLVHLVEELTINIVIVLGSPRLTQELTKRFAGVKTTLEEPIAVAALDKSDGVVERDEGYLQQVRESAIKEYFFGDAKTTLSPFTQAVGFDDVNIYMSPDRSAYMAEIGSRLEKVDPEPAMAHWTLAMMNASLGDPPDKIRYASVMGFVYVAGVDKDRRRIKILAPVSGRIGDRPLVWGKWPEPHINLLG